MSGNLYRNFDRKVMQLIIYSQAASMSVGVDRIYPESFACGLLTSGVNDITSNMVKMDVDLESCLKKFKNQLSKKKSKNTKSEKNIPLTDVKPSEDFFKACKLADEIRLENGGDKIDISHMFISMVRSSRSFVNIFESEGVNISIIIDQLKSKKKSNTSKNTSKKSSLDKFCTSLSKMAAENQLDPIISRDKEIEMALTVLCRRSKNNPMFLGEPGVGKTAVVEGVAQRIASGTVPKVLRDYEVFSLNLSSLVAGTKYRGEFEDRINSLIKEIISKEKCILFIDEIHTMIGAGSASGGSMDASNILKPFLSKGKLRCIGATTNKEFKKYFEKDGALTRRFQEIIIEEPNREQMFKILHGIKPNLEQYHDCIISDEAIDASIKLCERYMPFKNFPDKSIETLDTACAKYAWTEGKKDKKMIVVMSDIASVISDHCKMPIEVIMWDNNERHAKIEETVSSRVFGQDEALKKVCRYLKNAYSGIRNPNKPIGSFIFGGESGTGKTHTAKELAYAVFGSRDAFIRLDMSEFSERHTVSKLIGSPPGYVGFSDTDIFLDKIRRKPYSIVLLDEIEKAHPFVMRLFLQVMSDGVMTDSEDNQVNFKNVILIMTGNFGMNTVVKKPMGFGAKDVSTIIKTEQSRLLKGVEERFGAEFVNRVDEIIPFLPLGKDSVKRIIRQSLEELNERVIDRNCVIKYTDKLVDFIAEKSMFGHGKNANMINRNISREIEPVLSDALIEIGNKPYIITVNFNGKNIVYSKRKNKI